MPAVSKQQRKFMGLVHAVQKGEVPASKVSKSARDAAKQIKKKDVEDFASTDEKGLPKKKQKEAVSVNEAGGVVTARIQQKPKGYWAVFNSRGQSQFEGNKKFMINILKKASTLSPNAIGSILDRARPGDKHLEFKAQFSRYYFDESVDESGILYRAGVKKYGKEGMRKIQQAAGKRKSHAEIGKIKDKYEKDKKESVNETWNQLRTNLMSIVKRKQHQKIDGVLVDMQTANVILKVWDALNSSNRKKFEKLSVKKMANVAWKLVS